MPYLADAVPGWFQATVALFDSAGKEVAYADDYRFQPDPVLHYTIPADGDYIVEIKDAIFRGREDFVYRLSHRRAAVCDGHLPARRARAREDRRAGVGLEPPDRQLTMDATGAGPGTAMLTVRRGRDLSQPRALRRGRAPRASSNASPTTRRTKPQRAHAAGHRQRPHRRGRRRGRVRVEGPGGRPDRRGGDGAPPVGSPLDSVVEIDRRDGRAAGFNDDEEDKGAGLMTHQADSRLRSTLPADGTVLRARRRPPATKAGPSTATGCASARRSRISNCASRRPKINAGAGTSVLVTAHAIRKDGFTGDIALALKDAPAGFTLSGGVVPAGRDQVRFTLNVPPMRPGGADSRCASKAARRSRDSRWCAAARAAEDMMQAFAYRHLVPADSVKVAVIARGGARVPARMPGADRQAAGRRVRADAGGAAGHAGVRKRHAGTRASRPRA